MTDCANRVLIVDDQPSLVDVLAEALASEHELLVATSAARALELAPAADLILLDVMMPDMDGLEVCRRLKADESTRRIPVIFVTALEQTEDETQGFDAGAVDYIVKPINPAIVRARVRTHLELKAARDILERLATVDGLTGIANRRRFDDALNEEWRRSTRTSRPLTLAIADIDHFKAFNDKHGHAGGDACLRRVAEVLQRLCRRPGEVAARFGGEEFAFILPEVDLDGARQFAVRALNAVIGIEIENLALPGSIGLSVGAVTLIPAPDGTIEEALNIADEGLYKAKKGGRRRAVVCDMESGVASELFPEI
jgi:diguanylate cyclase (GGDEF)-like protein